MKTLVLKRATLAGALALAAPLSGALAQRANDPATCPYCGGDPEIMAAAGIVSHGGFEFGSSDTAAIDELMATSDIRWIETKHFEIGFAIGSYKVKQGDKEKVRGELAVLAETMPEIQTKTKILDPWLRTHMYALRCERIWDRFLELMQVEESQFPKRGPWNMKGKYMGEGPYVGQEGKYELLLLPSEAASLKFLKEQFGLLIRRTQRWNVLDRDTLVVVAHEGQGQLRNDAAMHGHVTFNLTINLLDGYKHYSYETPVWIREGLAHFTERELNPKHNSFDSSEGAVAEMTRKEKWEPEVRKLIGAGRALRMAELVALKDFSGLKLEHHFTTWSMVDYLVKTNPDGFACLNDRLHGFTNAQGIPDGGQMEDKHREAFTECLGMGYAAFDRAWSEWVLANYSSK